MNSLQTIIEQAWENRALLQKRLQLLLLEKLLNSLTQVNCVLQNPKGDGWQIETNG
jgi:2,3,4,5-tetrahydropyridine-2-carboxylate N-succinyltransferase